MASGRTLWDELVVRYSRGVAEVAAMEERWASLAPYVDAARHDQVAAFLRIQVKEARWWRDACIAYFQTFAQQPLPEGYDAPEHSLDWYRALQFPDAPGHEARPRRFTDIFTDIGNGIDFAVELTSLECEC